MVLDIAHYSLQDGKLFYISFDEELINKRDYDSSKCMYDFYVMAESNPEHCGDERQSRRVEGLIGEIRANLQLNDLIQLT